MANGINDPIDPEDPTALTRWIAIVATTLPDLRQDITDIKTNLAARDEWRIGIESRLAVGAQRFADQAESIREIRGTLADVPKVVSEAVSRAMAQTEPAKKGNPGNGNGSGPSFRWALEKIALPLLMSGVTTAVMLILARAMGLIVGPAP